MNYICKHIKNLFLVPENPENPKNSKHHNSVKFVREKKIAIFIVEIIREWREFFYIYHIKI